MNIIQAKGLIQIHGTIKTTYLIDKHSMQWTMDSYIYHNIFDTLSIIKFIIAKGHVKFQSYWLKIFRENVRKK